jgi:hypothetical protein
MSFVSALLILCASMAGSRPDACVKIRPEHVLAPFALPWGVLLVVHMPTVLLASRERGRRLCAATARVLVVWAAGAGVAWAYTRSPPIAYALALHSAAHLLLAGPELRHAPAARAVRWACLACLATGAWQLGPPLPIVDLAHPGHPLAHLVGLLAPELLLAPAALVVERLVLSSREPLAG